MKKYDLFYCIGDSFVFAVDQADDPAKTINNQNRFTGLIASHYNLQEVNKGLPGASNEYIFRTIYSDMEVYSRNNIKPLVLLLYTDCSRKEIWSTKDRNPVTLGNHCVSSSFIKEWYAEHFDVGYNKIMTNIIITAIGYMLAANNIDFVDGYSITLREVIEENNTHLPMCVGDFCGFDRFSLMEDGDHCGHPTVQGHKRIAKWIIDKIDSLYNT